MKKVKILTSVLAIILVTLIAFGGIYLPTQNRMENKVKDYELGRELDSQRVIELKIKENSTDNSEENSSEETTDSGNTEETEKSEETTSTENESTENKLTAKDYENAKKIMEKNLYKCCVVDDGYEALKILETEIFDIILMDINMPLLNGFETTRLIRNKNITTPIIALTAFDKEEISEEAISAGMNDIIIKPFDQSKLFKAMSTLIYDAKNVG